jgi:serpin B
MPPSYDPSEIAKIASARVAHRGLDRVTQDEIITAINNTSFALNLFKQLCEQQDNNIFFSPYSISTALAMTYAGAKEQTESEMAEVLRFGMTQQRVHRTFGVLAKSLQKRGNHEDNEFTLANALWIQKGFELLSGFQYTISENYGENLFDIEFSEPEDARAMINDWIEEQTRDKIKELIKPNVLTSGTRLVLTNAVYFLGRWRFPFDESETKEADFMMTENSHVKVQMMHQKKEFGYTEDYDVQVLELPYSTEDNLAMVVILPKDMNNFSKIEGSLTVEMLDNWTRQLINREVIVDIPRFKVTHGLSLKQQLEDLGMKAAFSIEQADFSKMTEAPGVYIGEVIHQAYIDVNEEGTEAAAATAVVMLAKGPAPEIPYFNVNHPFLFFIKDKLTDSILFLGRVVDPTIS